MRSKNNKSSQSNSEEHVVLAQLCNKVPIGYNGTPKIHPQNCPFPFDDYTIPACKKRVAGDQHGYLTGARCRFAYDPADPTATHCLLLQEIQIGFGFTFLVPAHLGSPGQNPELGTLSCSLTPHIHLTILISACWNSTSFSFLTDQDATVHSLILNLSPWTGNWGDNHSWFYT